jgi:hypothetical protein
MPASILAIQHELYRLRQHERPREAAYRRGDLFEKRRRLIADWASYCEPSRITKLADRTFNPLVASSNLAPPSKLSMLTIVIREHASQHPGEGRRRARTSSHPHMSRRSTRDRIVGAPRLPTIPPRSFAFDLLERHASPRGILNPTMFDSMYLLPAPGRITDCQRHGGVLLVVPGGIG